MLAAIAAARLAAGALMGDPFAAGAGAKAEPVAWSVVLPRLGKAVIGRGLRLASMGSEARCWSDVCMRAKAGGAADLARANEPGPGAVSGRLESGFITRAGGLARCGGAAYCR